MPRIPKLSSLRNKILWLIVSKALLRSRKVVIVRFFVALSFSSAIWLTNCKTGCVVECPGLKPY